MGFFLDVMKHFLGCLLISSSLQVQVNSALRSSESMIILVPDFVSYSTSIPPLFQQ